MSKQITCIYCNDPFILEDTNNDHIIPVSKEGCEHDHNKLRVCIECNEHKGKMPVYMWLKCHDMINVPEIAKKVIQAVDCLVETNHQLIKDKNKLSGEIRVLQDRNSWLQTNLNITESKLKKK